LTIKSTSHTLERYSNRSRQLSAPDLQLTPLPACAAQKLH
jgi:hypothetical protein